MPECRNARTKVSPASAFRHKSHSGTAGHVLDRYCPALTYPPPPAPVSAVSVNVPLRPSAGQAEITLITDWTVVRGGGRGVSAPIYSLSPSIWPGNDIVKEK
jgi:hypothetical protein